jgi:hypothetical protein
LENIKFELKICKKLPWCHYDKKLEQSKQIEEEQRLEHAKELETCAIKKNQIVI